MAAHFLAFRSFDSRLDVLSLTIFVLQEAITLEDQSDLMSSSVFWAIF